jgi:hypothetical protein
MSVVIEIKGTPIEFPSTGESPNWAPAVIQFAQSVEEALLASSISTDIAPQVYDIPADALTEPRVIINLKFDSSLVRAAFINYSLYFDDSGEEGKTSESGTITVTYDGSIWHLSREYVRQALDGSIIFDIDSSGQVTLQTPPLVGYTTSRISFSAKTLSQSS